METGLNLNDPKIITKLNQAITEEFVQTINSDQLETLLNKISAENCDITVKVTGGHITSPITIFEDFDVYIKEKENKETELLEELFVISDNTGELGNYFWDNLEVAEIYWDSWSNVFRVYFNESYEAIEIEYFDIDLDAEDLQDLEV